MREPVILKKPVFIKSCAAVGGKKEAEIHLTDSFDMLDKSERYGMKSFERAEGEMSRLSLSLALKKSAISHEELRVVVSGDLQNQCVASSGGLFSFGAPYIGLYGACSTLTEGLIVASLYLSQANKGYGAVVTSSHGCVAERQFRAPLEYGGQRSPSSQLTATASGAFVLTNEEGDVGISAVMAGKIIDGYTKDKTNMGAAMALSAFDTVYSYFKEESPDDYDLILTGDLGLVGSSILHELIRDNMPKYSEKIISSHKDAGAMLYRELKDTHAGASGCGCSAAYLALDIIPRLKAGGIRRMLLMSTGALMSVGSVNQGEHISGITPLIKIERFS